MDNRVYWTVDYVTGDGQWVYWIRVYEQLIRWIIEFIEELTRWDSRVYWTDLTMWQEMDSRVMLTMWQEMDSRVYWTVAYVTGDG